MTLQVRRAPLAKDQLHGLSTKNKEHGKNYENYRNATPFFVAPSSRSGGAAHAPAAINACPRLSARAEIGGGATDPGASQAGYCYRASGSGAPEAQRPARTSFLVSKTIK